MLEVANLSTIRDYSIGWVTQDGDPVKPFSPWQYLGYICGLHDAAAFVTLFLPEFCIHEGMIFLSKEFDKETYESYIASGFSDQEISFMINHVHVIDLFPYKPEQIDSEVAQFVGNGLAESWTAKLEREFGSGSAYVELEEPETDPQLIIKQGSLIHG